MVKNTSKLYLVPSKKNFMTFKNYLSVLAVLVLFISCGEDDNTPEAIPFRDRGEQSITDDAFIREYLETHFYNYEEFANPPENFDYEIRFDTIAGNNADKTPLIQQVESKTYDRFEASNTLYILTAREGALLDENGEENHRTTFADSTLMVLQMGLLTLEVVLDLQLQMMEQQNLITIMVLEQFLFQVD